MKAYFSALLAAALVLAPVRLVVAQSVLDLLSATPECARPCLGEAVASASCDLTTVEVVGSCICANQTLQADLSACVQLACSFGDQVEAATILGGLCAEYPIESRSTEVKITIIASLVLTLFIVVLRCISRWNVSNQLWWDDWTTILAFAFFVGLCAVQLVGSTLGFGKHYWNVKPENAQPIFQLFYAAQILYILVQVTAKVSILILFGRIFTSKSLQRAILVCNIFLVGHGFIYMMLIILQCLPVHAVWDRSVTAKCLNITAITFSGAIFSVIEDIVIFALPIKEVFQLRLTLQKRIALILMFSIGSFACVTSMMRLKYIVSFANSLDATWDNVNIVIWSIIEVACAIICGCLPTLRPLFRKVPGLLTSLKSQDQSKSTSSNRQSKQVLGRSRQNSQPFPPSGPFEKIHNSSRYAGKSYSQRVVIKPGKSDDIEVSPSVGGHMGYELQQWTTDEVEKEQTVRPAV